MPSSGSEAGRVLQGGADQVGVNGCTNQNVRTRGPLPHLLIVRSQLEVFFPRA